MLKSTESMQQRNDSERRHDDRPKQGKAVWNHKGSKSKRKEAEEDSNSGACSCASCSMTERDFNEAFFNGLLAVFAKHFEELSGVAVRMNLHDERYQGICNCQPVGEYDYEKKMRSRRQVTTEIRLSPRNPTILFTFLHELTHAITPCYERKVKSRWVQLDHSDKFYHRFLQVMRIAREKHIVHYELTFKELMRKDDATKNFRSDLAKYGK